MCFRTADSQLPTPAFLACLSDRIGTMLTAFPVGSGLEIEANSDEAWAQCTVFLQHFKIFTTLDLRLGRCLRLLLLHISVEEFCHVYSITGEEIESLQRSEFRACEILVYKHIPGWADLEVIAVYHLLGA